MTSTLEHDDAPVLSVAGLSKDFQGQRALDDVDLQLWRGEVHCLLGQNGSGKSTLVKILAGYHTPEAGARATAYGEPLQLGSAQAATVAGMRFIHQDLALIDRLSVVDNLALGRRYSRSLWVSERAERRAASKVLAHYGVAVDASATVATLGQAEKTMTAIVRALHNSDAAQSILVLDEPTASLPETSRAHLFSLIRDIVDRGGTVLYVTHRLQEVFEIGDRVSVLRDGHLVATRDVAALDHDQLVELIVGRPVGSMYPDPPPPGADIALQVDKLAGGKLHDFTVSVYSGEVVGVVGLTGSGVDDVTHLLFGAKRARSGTVSVAGSVVDYRSPCAAIGAGIAFVPADRKRLGGIADWPLSENITLPAIPQATVLRWLSSRRERAMSRSHLERFNVTPADPGARFSSLSGGNQQKVMIARWIRCGGRVLLLEEPTAGVDVGAKVAIYDAITNVAATGTAVLLSTSDFEEACSICDRVLVVRDGRVVATLSGSTRTTDHILSEALGRLTATENRVRSNLPPARAMHETRSHTS